MSGYRRLLKAMKSISLGAPLAAFEWVAAFWVLVISLVLYLIFSLFQVV